jgi:polynucleotide 5'-kinase involved in rRNA processing
MEILHLNVEALSRPQGIISNNFHKWPRLVVVGNPGIGKSMLSFLFIRVLLELGVEVCLV